MPAQIIFTVDEQNKGRSVEKILRSNFNVSSSVLKQLKINSALFLNEKNCRTIDICNLGDVIIADVSENISHNDISINLWKHPLDILYDDDFLTVVNKPGGMESHPCPSNRETTLANAVMYYWFNNGEYHNYHIVNRLDKETSGICIIAKSSFSHGVISAQMKNNIFKRNYTAIVHGTIDPAEGILELPISRSDDSIIKRTVSPNGKYAKTIYKVIDKFENYSLVDIMLETGRTHQIRVHFSHIGHPLVGDWLYGNGDNEKELISRQALHANMVEFLHPSDKRQMQFKVEIPHDMKKLLKVCEKEIEI